MSPASPCIIFETINFELRSFRSKSEIALGYDGAMLLGGGLTSPYDSVTGEMIGGDFYVLFWMLSCWRASVIITGFSLT